MKRLGLFFAVAAVAAGGLLGRAVEPAAQPEKIGLYDSRSLAIAYAGSAVFAQQLNALRAEHKKAVAENNTKRAAELQMQGRTGQAQLHSQGFGTASVTNLLAQIKDKLPEIMKTAGVTALVSKWDAATLAQHKDAARVDVTLVLINAFQPTDRQRQFALDIQQHPPISAQELEKHKE